MLNLDKHRTIMYRMLVEMFRDAFLASVLGFKGGTACYFFYGLPRFSVDLDFDLINKETGSTIGEKVFGKIKDIVVKEGLKIRDESLKRNTIFFMVSYQDESQNIKIEISQRDYPNTYEMKDFYGLPLRVLSRPDIFAHKLVAVTDRKKTAARDFFDVYFFLKENWPINDEIIRVRTGKEFKEYLIALKNFVESYLSNRNVLQGLGEILDEKQKVWVKHNLKKELLSILSFHIDKGV